MMCRGRESTLFRISISNMVEGGSIDTASGAVEDGTSAPIVKSPHITAVRTCYVIHRNGPFETTLTVRIVERSILMIPRRKTPYRKNDCRRRFLPRNAHCSIAYPWDGPLAS